jgi:transcriptional regulator with XRE-family HTH domain
VPECRFGGDKQPHHYPEGKKIAMNTILQDEGIFGVHLRRARLAQKRSQEELAEIAGISARHMSFIETGRSRPSRDVVLRLGDALEMSANERNALLRLAGFAPAFAPADLAPAEQVLALDAVSKLLDAQGVIPAVASDSLGNILEMNGAARRLFSIAGDKPVVAGDNIFELFFSDTATRAAITNWREVAPALLHHLEQEALIAPNRAEAGRLIARIRRLAGPEIEPSGAELPIFRFEIRSGDRHLCLVSNYSTFGVPYDATMQSIRIECFFPADRETQSFLETLMAERL